MLTYRETAPPPALAPFVRCFWTLTGELDGTPERILPDGAFELVLHRGTPFPSQPAAMLMGEIRRPVVVQPTGPADVLGVRFHPGGAAPFFPFPMKEARDLLLPLETLPDAYDIPTVTSFLMAQRRSQRHQRLAHGAVAEVRRQGGDLRVHDLAARLGATERTLERAFDEVIGIGPKQFCRLVRFHEGLRTDDTLAYYDQSHLIHEFRALAGVTPTELRRERNAVNSAFVGEAFVGNLQS